VQVNSIATTKRWINTAGGDWDVASNWDTNAVPGVNDDVIIDLAVTNPITHGTSPLQVKSLTMSAGQLTVSGNAIFDSVTLSGGTATFNSATSVVTFTQTGGTVTGNGTITLTGTGAQISTWSGGSLAGSGKTILNGQMQATAGSSGLTLTREIVVGDAINPASFTLNGTGKLTMTVANLVPGKLTIRNSASLIFDAEADLTGTGAASGTFIVTLDAGAVLTKSGAGTTTDFTSVKLVNNGLVDIQSGSLRLLGGSQTQDGNFNVAGGATLDLNVGPEHAFTGNGGITGNGTVAAEQGFVKRGAGTTTTVTPTVNIFGTVTAESGTLNLTGTVTNQNTLTVATAGTFIISGNLTNYNAATRTLTGANATFRISGTLRVAGADILKNAATISLIGSSWQFLNDTTGLSALASLVENSTGSTFSIDTGTFTTSGSFTNFGTFWMKADGIFHVTGTFTNQAGTVRIDAVSDTHFGHLQIDGNAVLNSGLLQITQSVPLTSGTRLRFMTFASRSGFFFSALLPSGSIDQSHPTYLEWVV